MIVGQAEPAFRPVRESESLSRVVESRLDSKEYGRLDKEMGSGLCCGNWTGSPTGLHQSPQVSNPSYHNEFGTWHSGYVGAEDSPTSRQLPQRTLSVHGDCNFPHTLSP